jgi:hypothetical protein
MKKILVAILVFFATQSIAQVAQYRVINGKLIINAIKNGEAYRFTNNNILVNLNYQDGSFLLKLSNEDFYQVDSVTNSRLQDTLTRQDYNFSGILPINDIINQQSTVQNYNVELQLINDNLDIDQTINMNMTITLPNASGQANYRIFDMNGILYNDQLLIPSLIGYDNEIQFWIQFAGISTSN